MEEKKSLKVSLGLVICMFIILILIFALIIVYYFGFVADKNKIELSNTNSTADVNVNNSNENISNTNSTLDVNVNNSNKNLSNVNNSNVSTDNKTQFKTGTYIIQFDANLLGEEYETAGNEIKGCDYEFSFLDNNEFSAYMNWGNSIYGSYTVSNNIINCIITSTSGDNAATQKIEGKISFKINSDSEIEITDITESYTIRVSDISDEGWVLTDETKEMSFWPLVKGIKFVSNK